jgi:hypothetical protein
MRVCKNFSPLRVKGICYLYVGDEILIPEEGSSYRFLDMIKRFGNRYAYGQGYVRFIAGGDCYFSERAGKDIGFCAALSAMNAYCSEKFLFIIFLLIPLSVVCNSLCTL